MTVLVEAFGDVTVDSFAAEARVVRHAVPERRREHATVRACARAALVQLGQRPAPILNDPDGVPVWPLGVVVLRGNSLASTFAPGDAAPGPPSPSIAFTSS